jgi:cytochrome d ubiquinol oxidase subunit I
MPDLLAARAQMGVSLAFHIVFAVIGIAMPLLMVVAEVRWLRSGDTVYLELARRWAKGTAVLFAVGAVSGTVLSFELGLLWPGFMELAGPIIGIPFSLEGFAFFVEAIFLGVYLYGWTRIPARAHVAAGVLVALSGALSGVFVVIVNAWMNAPTGFTLDAGRIVAVDPLAAMANDLAFTQTLHMTLAAYATTGLAVAGIHAWALRRDPMNAFHLKALKVALLVAPRRRSSSRCPAISPRGSGPQPARQVRAMEALFVTQRGAPLTLGGWPDVEARRRGSRSKSRARCRS